MRALWFSVFPAPAAPRGWDFRRLALAFVITFLLQLVTLPCLCAKGAVKWDLGCTLDFLVLVRVLVAFLQRERGNTWIFYAALLYTSPIWIVFVVESLGVN